MYRFTPMLVSSILWLAGCTDREPLRPDVGDATARFQTVPAGEIVPDEYIIVFWDTVTNPDVRTRELLASAPGAEARHVFRNTIKGFAGRIPADVLEQITGDGSVRYFEPNRLAELTTPGVQNGPTWGLDRIDQRELPLNDRYAYPNTAGNVWVYVVDTGIRFSHEEFGGRATFGADFHDNPADGVDCQGHGTHVAGTIGGATYGVAKNVRLVAVRVGRPCPSRNLGWDQFIAAADWVTGEKLANPGRDMIANASIGGSSYQPVDDAVAASIAAGVHWVTSAGNNNANACNSTPARVAAAVTAGATDRFDVRASFSNHGDCVDLFAPGVEIEAAGINSDTEIVLKDGTSMASPHVAGVAALLLQENPGATPAELQQMIVDAATRDVLDLAGRPGPNLLLYVAGMPNEPPDLGVDQGTVTVDEGSIATNSGTVSDPDGDPIALSASVGTVVDNGDGTWSWSYETTDGPAQAQTVTVTASDGEDQTSATFSLVVRNVAPIVDAGPDASIDSNETFQFSGTFSDPGTIDFPWGWTIDWGDGSSVSGSTNFQSTPITGSRQFCAAQDYTIRLTVTDKDGGVGFDETTLSVAYGAIGIMIRPVDHPNPINLGSRGRLPVAVLSSADFDASALDPATVVLGDETGTDTPVARRNNGTYFASIEDVNGDGRPDLVLHFEIPALVANGDLTLATTQLVLRGFLGDGCTNVRGADAVRVVP